MDHFIPISSGQLRASEFDPVPNRSREVIGLCIVLTAMPAAIDLFTVGFNVSMLYVVPLLLLAQTGKRHRLWPFTILVLCLTYGMYFSHFGTAVFTDPASTLTWRLMNRTMVAVTLCVTSTALYLWLGVRQRLSHVAGTVPDRTSFAELADALDFMFGLFLCAVLIACIVALDLWIPGEYNLPLLYAVPLLIAHRLESRRLLWVLLPLMILLSIIGFKFGHPPDVHRAWLGRIMTNRVLAVSMLVIFALILRLFIPLRHNPQASD